VFFGDGTFHHQAHAGVVAEVPERLATNVLRSGQGGLGLCYGCLEREILLVIILLKMLLGLRVTRKHERVV
jgi:hypothetical protein